MTVKNSFVDMYQIRDVLLTNSLLTICSLLCSVYYCPPTLIYGF